MRVEMRYSSGLRALDLVRVNIQGGRRRGVPQYRGDGSHVDSRADEPIAGRVAYRVDANLRQTRATSDSADRLSESTRRRASVELAREHEALIDVVVAGVELVGRLLRPLRAECTDRRGRKRDRRHEVYLVAVPPDSSKEARASAVTALFESGRVLLPDRAHWVDAFIDEMCAFPNGRHDDQVDAFVLALRQIVPGYNARDRYERNARVWGRLVNP